MELEYIEVRGAREHNLKNIDIDIPKKKMVVITGVSGSGKSSLAFDTLFAEGQRRYVESLSSYARQFLGQMEKPLYETIRGLSPTIAIEQKAASKNPRSTVGTITEIYDYLRVLFARIGEQTCHICGKKVGRGDASTMVERILAYGEGTKALILAPLVDNRKGEHRELLLDMKAQGFVRARIDGVVTELDEGINLAKHKKHNIEIVIDRIAIKSDAAFRTRLTDSVETALKLGQGRLILHIIGREDIPMSEHRTCCGFAFAKLDPPLFSFNAPQGMCPSCHGLGSVMGVDPKKIIRDDDLSIEKGAIIPWDSSFASGKLNADSWVGARIYALHKQWKISLTKPWKDLTEAQQNLILYGKEHLTGKKSLIQPKPLRIEWTGERSSAEFETQYRGLVDDIWRKYQTTTSDTMKDYYLKFMSTHRCQSCHGARLKPEILAVKINDKSIVDVTSLNIEASHHFISHLTLSENQELIAKELVKEIRARLQFLINVGLSYLHLNREGPTLSGGEAQRIRLASQIGSELTGVLYILDEPSIGLHQRDNEKLIKTLQHLRDIGNSVLVVEHDEDTIATADWVIDMGPGAGHLGGQVVGAGTPKDLAKQPHSVTGAYLSGKKAIKTPDKRRSIDPKRQIVIHQAKAHNLKNVTCTIPLGVLTCVTGVSGAGKSTLINQILYPAIANKLHAAQLDVAEHKAITGLNLLDKCINIDQKPIGRTPRSNPATYSKVYDPIRSLFAQLPESKIRNYDAGRFSFNIQGGRCEVCKGDGSIKVEMHFLADVYVPCEACQKKRFNAATLEVKYQGLSIADVLDLSVAEARERFNAHKQIVQILDTLIAVGLTYIKLGQPSTTLSGGEAQRVKLAKELARRGTGKTLYILDEPTTGLHFDDVARLIEVLQRLVDAGNAVVVIEHNLDVIKCADWVIDMGPEGGVHGGAIIAEGTPEQVSTVKGSYTGQFLRKILQKS